MDKLHHDIEQNGHKQMKISQLCKESGFKRSTIHYYVKIGILGPPKKLGLNLFVYDEKHLAQLKEIRRLREQENLPLPVIRDVLQKHEEQPGVLPGKISEEKLAAQKKEQILKIATDLFSQKGYERTTISDIAGSLSMSRGTFYLYFKDKKELFIECIERLTLAIVPKEAWDDIRNEKDPVRRVYARGRAFQRAFPGFRGILNLVRQAMVGEDPLLAQKAKDIFRSMVQPLAKDFRRGIEQGGFREMDEELISYFSLALSEMLGFRLTMDDRYTLEEGLALLFNFTDHGILAQKADPPDKDQQKALEAEVLDQKGVKAVIKGIHFGGKNNLMGRLGKAELQLELQNLDLFRVRNSSEGCQVEVTMQDGQSVTLEVNGDTDMSGQTPFGRYRIPLKAISMVNFLNND